MKRTSIIFLVLCVLASIIACKSKLEKEQNFTITGQISGFSDGTKLYLHNLSISGVIDSVEVEKGSFKFNGQFQDTPELVRISTAISDEYIYTDLLIGNEEVDIDGDISDFPWGLEIKGSKAHEDYYYAQNIFKETQIKSDSITMNFMKLSEKKQNEKYNSVIEKLTELNNIEKDLRLNYVKSHPDAFASIINLEYLIHQIPKDTVRRIFDNYSARIKKSKYARIIEVFLNEHISKIGEQYQDFEGENQKGEKIRFSEIRGNFTLIDFTSAFCGPCIQAVEELIEIKGKYSDSLTIVSVSGDSKKEDWLKSLERDGVTWNSVWDGKGRYSKTPIKYDVQGIPYFVLINPEGVIIDKWFGYGKGSLKIKLNKYLSHK